MTSEFASSETSPLPRLPVTGQHVHQELGEASDRPHPVAHTHRVPDQQADVGKEQAVVSTIPGAVCTDRSRLARQRRDSQIERRVFLQPSTNLDFRRDLAHLSCVLVTINWWLMLMLEE